MSYQSEISRNVAQDYKEGWVVVRDETGSPVAADSSAKSPSVLTPIIPEASTLVAAFAASNLPAEQSVGRVFPLGVFWVGGARTIGMRVFTDGTADTVRVALKEFYHPPLSGYRTVATKSQATAPILYSAKGQLVFDLTFTTGGSATANIHPITGEAVLSTSFYEAVNITTYTYKQDARFKEYPDATAGTNEKWCAVDAMGAKLLYPEITAVSGNPGRVIIAMRKID